MMTNYDPSGPTNPDGTTGFQCAVCGGGVHYMTIPPRAEGVWPFRHDNYNDMHRAAPWWGPVYAAGGAIADEYAAAVAARVRN